MPGLSHTHSARIVFQGTLLAAYCVGFLLPLESFAILSLHTFVRTLEELTRQEAEELDPHEHAVLSNPAKILACEFYSRTYRSASTH